MQGIINPTLENIDKYLDDLMDKNGSDYNSLPVKLDRFIACTYNIIESTEVYLDGTQSLSDDIRPLIVERSDISINRDSVLEQFEIPVPLDYLRLVTAFPLVNGRRLAREVKILKNGQEEYELNPFRKSTPEYVNIFRVGDFFKVKTGKDNNNYDAAYMKYIKHPTFATENEFEKRIVNVSTELIIKICDIVADSFRYTTGDVSAQAVEAFNAKYGKRNRS